MTTVERIDQSVRIGKLKGKVEKVRHELVESILCLQDREEPNVGSCLRHLRRIESMLDDVINSPVNLDERP